MENKSKNKWLVEASFMAAITFILMMLTVIPMFDLIGAFVVPIPITVLYLRHGKKSAWLCAIVSGVLSALFYDPLWIIKSIILYGAMGITLGYCIKQEKSIAKTIGFLTVINGIGNIINYGLMFTLFSGISFTQYLQEIVDIFHQTANMLTTMGVATSSSSEQIINLYKSVTVDYLITILPAVFILSVIISSFLNFIIARGILRRLGFKVKSLPPFSRWYLDNRILGVLVILFCISFALASNKIIYSEAFFTTMIYLLTFVFMIQSLSVIAYFLKSTLKLSNILIVFIEIIILISPFSLYIIALGIADFIMDIRGVDPNSFKNLIKEKIKKLNKK